MRARGGHTVCGVSTCARSGRGGGAAGVTKADFVSEECASLQHGVANCVCPACVSRESQDEGDKG